MEEKNFNLLMDKVFNECYGKNKIIFDSYKNLYNLDIIKVSCKVSKKLFEYTLRKSFFVLLILYDKNGKIYLQRNMSDNLYWDIPGGSVKDNETIYMALNRIAKSVDNNIILGNVEPVILIENVFNYKENKVMKHYGLVFMGRVRNFEKINCLDLTGNFIDITNEELKYINRTATKKAVHLFLERFEKINKMSNNDFQDEEITTNEKMKARYYFHNKFIKKYILTKKRKRKKEFYDIISKIIGNANSIIDVSCGEDEFIFNLSRNKNIELVVGNDISWSQIDFLNNKFKEVIFTNHNAATLPFKMNSFDIAYCSNTLHHMPNKTTLINMLNTIFEVSSKVIIVEIENPEITGGFPKWLNKNWYIKFLKDVGGAYLSEEEFKILITKIFKNKAKLNFLKFENIMGKYMIAEITKEETNG